MPKIDAKLLKAACVAYDCNSCGEESADDTGMWAAIEAYEAAKTKEQPVSGEIRLTEPTTVTISSVDTTKSVKPIGMVAGQPVPKDPVHQRIMEGHAEMIRNLDATERPTCKDGLQVAGQPDEAPHPEKVCQDCGGRNPVWFAPNPVWNLVMGGPAAKGDPGGIVCPVCFIARAENCGVNPTGWELMPEGDSTPERESVDWQPIETAPKGGMQ